MRFLVDAHLPRGSFTVIGSYTGLLQQMGRRQQEIQTQLDALGRPFGRQFGGGA